MKIAELFAEYLSHLFAGRRYEARRLLLDAHDHGTQAGKLLRGVVWPAMEQIEELYRAHEISLIVEHMASRVNRMVADQLQGLLPREPRTGKRIVVVCGEGENEELGAQMTADVFEAKGWITWFIGAGVPNDEILAFVADSEPDILCLYGTRPRGVPDARRLIDLIREVGVCEEMQILASGGVFNRAEGLAEEINADLFAPNVAEALKVVAAHPVRVPKPDVPQPGRRRKRKRAETAKADMRGDVGSDSKTPAASE
ncbi:MAG: cobalamin B12-binding domain-containing protein [Planctomycetota bacterium]|jgi:methanogenic corrinoid protein MtbC1